MDVTPTRITSSISGEMAVVASLTLLAEAEMIEITAMTTSTVESTTSSSGAKSRTP